MHPRDLQKYSIFYKKYNKEESFNHKYVSNWDDTSDGTWTSEIHFSTPKGYTSLPVKSRPIVSPAWAVLSCDSRVTAYGETEILIKTEIIDYIRANRIKHRVLREGVAMNRKSVALILLRFK